MTMYLAISTALAWDTVGLNTAPCAAQERASAHAHAHARAPAHDGLQAARGARGVF